MENTIVDNELAIIARIREYYPTLLVEPFPDQYQVFNELPIQDEAVLIRYLGSAMSTPDSMDSMFQERTFDYEIGIIVEKLRGAQGSYELLEGIINRLTGYCPIEDCPLWCKSVRFAGQTKTAFWVWSLVFSLKSWETRSTEVQG